MKRIYVLKNFFLLLMTFSFGVLMAQSEKKELIQYGDMNTWMVREVDESAIIGGNTKYIYTLAKGDTLKDNTPYKKKDSPWATSSVLAKVSGVTKASVTVFPEKRGNGYAARLETRIEHVKVLGLININVLASGAIFLGEMLEPITGTKDPQSKLVTGVPFTKRPKALEFDYKVTAGGTSIRSTGFGKQKILEQKDKAEVYLLLQHRWEDAEGNVYANRVATGWEQFGKSVSDWQNAHRVPLWYGDISKESYYRSYMALNNGEGVFYTRNSKGKMVPIHEIGWAKADEMPTHMIMQFSSSNGGAYVGSTDNRFWVDNVTLVY